MQTITEGVAYFRVWSGKLARPELSLEVQRTAIQRLCGRLDVRLIRPSFYEVEVSRGRMRPELLLAIARCRQVDAALIIARIANLSRNLAFLGVLRASGINFVAADMPEVNGSTVDKLFMSLNGTTVAAARRQQKADEYAEFLRPTVERILAQGHTTFRGIACELERSGAVPRRGGPWYPTTVRNLLARLKL